MRGEIKGQDILAVNEISIRIESLFNKIEDFCKSNSTVEKLNTKMEKFNLKTAVSLLPVMTGEEEVTKNLIDSIELYNSMIDGDSKPLLIQFILKTRLSESAKLRLAPSYNSCDSLLKDMKDTLLTKKSSTAVHSELINARQYSKSIDEYGKSLEKLFVDLTISEADGDQEAYKILKPINEKLAVKRFAEGLRDRNLSLIISARNYPNLKEAIQGAKDEEMSSSRAVAEPSVFMNQRGRAGRYPRYNSQGQGVSRQFRGNRGGRGGRYQGNQTFAQNNGRYVQFNYRGNNRGYRRGYFRGRNNNNINQNRRSINVLEGDNQVSENNNNQNNETLEFFRP